MKFQGKGGKTSMKISLSQKMHFAYVLNNREDYDDFLERKYKQIMKNLAQKTICQEYKQQINAEFYQRSPHRKAYRNGYYHRTYYDKYTSFKVKIPRARNFNVKFNALHQD